MGVVNNGKDLKEVKIVRYDNSFNKTSLNVLTEVQSDILMAVLERMGNKMSKDSDGNDCYLAKYEFKEIREMIDSKNMHAYKIKKVFDALLDTKVEFFEDGKYTKGNLFSHYTLTGKSTVEIVISNQLTKKLIVSKERYTILELDEYVSLRNKHSKELYRLLRQFRHSGILIIKKEDLMKFLKKPQTYDEYKYVKRVIERAIKDNSEFFEDLKLINMEGNRLPEVCKFTFKPHERQDLEKLFSGKSDEEIELLKYIIDHGGK